MNPATTQPDDGLDAMRGIVAGLVICTPFWLFVIAWLLLWTGGAK